MTLLDSSVWVEILTRGPRADEFRAWLEGDEEQLVPSIVLYEVFKRLRRDAPEEAATLGAARLQACSVVPLDDTLALEAADASLEHRLPMADAIVYATAHAYRAKLVTGDAHFANLPGVEYLGPGGEG